MTAVVQHPALVALRRRQRAGAINRRIGWVLLPVMVAATTMHYLPAGDSWAAGMLVVCLVVLNTSHLALSVYVFGFVRPRRTLKVFHIYFGYALGIVIWASQTNLDNEPLHTYLTILMALGIAGHLLLGVRYAARRRAAQHAAEGYLSG